MAELVPGAAREAVARLKAHIAAIEGRVERFEAPDRPQGGPGLKGARPVRGVIATGAPDLDAALGGGIPAAGLTEFCAATARDAGALTGFVLALLTRGRLAGPVFWIDCGPVGHEAGLLSGQGRQAVAPGPDGDLLLALPRRLPDALWMCEEAAATPGLGAVVLVMQGRAAGFGLTESRRLHLRARAGGRALFLLQVSAGSGASAAPLRLAVGPALSGARLVLAASAAVRSVPGGIGPPGFCVTVEKNKAGPAGSRHLIVWNRHDRRFEPAAASAQPIAAPFVPQRRSG